VSCGGFRRPATRWSTSYATRRREDRRHRQTRQVFFTASSPKPAAQIMRRLLRDFAEGKVLGDTTTLATRPSWRDQNSNTRELSRRRTYFGRGARPPPQSAAVESIPRRGLVPRCALLPAATPRLRLRSYRISRRAPSGGKIVASVREGAPDRPCSWPVLRAAECMGNAESLSRFELGDPCLARAFSCCTLPDDSSAARPRARCRQQDRRCAKRD